MPAPFWTTPQSRTRQIRIKTQNMIVLTVEFTRIPLFPAGRSRLNFKHRLQHPFRRPDSLGSHRKYGSRGRVHFSLPPGCAVTPIVLRSGIKFEEVNVTRRWESGALTGEIGGSGSGANVLNRFLGQNRFCRDADCGIGLKLRAAHPEDATA